MSCQSREKREAAIRHAVWVVRTRAYGPWGARAVWNDKAPAG